MARKLRVQYPGAIYHLMNRGDHSESIFRGRHDPELFLSTLSEACAKTDWQVHSFCLMSNHFHLVAETPRAGLVAGMKWLLSTYTSRFNRKHKLRLKYSSNRNKILWRLSGSRSVPYLPRVFDRFLIRKHDFRKRQLFI